MSPRVDLLNRLLFGLLAAALVAAGALGLLVSFGRYERIDPSTRVLPLDLARLAEQPWFWPATIATLVVLTVLALLWLAAQLRTNRLGRLDLSPDSRDGSTVVQSRALLDVAGSAAAGIPGVHRVKARMTGPARKARLVLRVEAGSDADLGEIRQAIESGVVRDVRQALEFQIPVRLELVTGVRPRQRVA